MLSAAYEWRLAINERKSLREKVGMVLRDIATRLDGRSSIAIDIQTTPPLSYGDRLMCIKAGFKTIQFALEETTRTEAAERILDVLMKAKNGSPS